MEQENNVMENISENVSEEPESIEQTNSDANLKEVIIGIPANTALMKVSVLTMDEDMKPLEQTGQFNIEQILVSRAKFQSLSEKAAKWDEYQKTQETREEKEEKAENAESTDTDNI